ncbi:MAG: tRNA (adenosine(37)-N6)-threonylcarbamoyltransferase complex ATPase subunit type 1 TsaE [Oscillospiraceae bacterium]|jgi:tRNA threonylcarbamoyladenosine biosynthesis protein TsaE|nr:tRNA (adenosine(37)-N6)-threonylcarbamoyltransferase complex ATPase subunit type 1 TsaE [Oscillospiraceae bacterium]
MKLDAVCHNKDETAALGASLAGELAVGDAVLLSGEMGAGKSVFARGVARALGVDGAMPSPTFMLMLPRRAAGGLMVYHIDLFRLDGAAAFYDAGLDEAFGGVALIEWPERCVGAFGGARRRFHVRIDYGGEDNERRVAIWREV